MSSEATTDDGAPAGGRSIIALIVATMVALCAVVPYAIVAVGLRLVMARVFFLEGQAKIEGPRLPINLGELQFIIVLPAQIKDVTFQTFEMQYAALPLSPTITAYLFTYAEFVLPICLILGFATRISAVLLLIMTVIMQVYVAPTAFWSLYVYWIAILMVLASVGPGAISIDAVIRYVYEK
jgi:putative oxidoreductase